MATDYNTLLLNIASALPDTQINIDIELLEGVLGYPVDTDNPAELYDTLINIQAKTRIDIAKKLIELSEVEKK